MKNFIYLLLVCAFIASCNTGRTAVSNKIKNEQAANQKLSDTVTIVNDDLEYEIIIIEPGFNYWLASQARPEGFYSQQYLENKNYQYVIEWNQRVNQPSRFNSSLYELQIDYQSNIDYGYDVNYKLYNYFIYFQRTYKQRLGPYNPRI
ncbi:DUF6146 family protein [Algibacter sp. L4_22]|uniref:DUF6146 family protein n=1 Tax=Algibacter sp. L4_22 TaxID=2942477 RepID=UPI00201B5D7F|nr:DUF6146 family protein [Algibacter sp. L4_22]MCL5127916.1 DUF6146 family protein [Algibacter sp. L4_22]